MRKTRGTANALMKKYHTLEVMSSLFGAEILYMPPWYHTGYHFSWYLPVIELSHVIREDLRSAAGVSIWLLSTSTTNGESSIGVAGSSTTDARKTLNRSTPKGAGDLGGRGGFGMGFSKR